VLCLDLNPSSRDFPSKTEPLQSSFSVQFDARIVPSLFFYPFANDHQLTGILLVPLANALVCQVMLNEAGLVCTTDDTPITTHYYLSLRGNRDGKGFNELFQLEEVMLTNYSSSTQNSLIVAGNFRDQSVYRFELKIIAEDMFMNMDVINTEGYAIEANPGLLGSITSFAPSFLYAKPQEKMVQTIKYLGNNLLCIIYQDNQAVIKNIITGENLCSKNLGDISADFEFKVLHSC
jgi:hypothetical protein